MKNSTASNRKTGRMIAKNLIILVVLVFVAILAMWAWFAINEDADASGINVKARGSGVEVSWDGTNYYENLTALTQEQVSGKTGLAKSLNDSENNPSPLKLITGDGLNFFEPYLNRRTGTELKNADGTWRGVTINDSNSSARYIDIDLHFRGDSEKNIYLAGDSSVSPKDATGNLSAYGDFSKDYICAASRVAFLNVDKTTNKKTCNFIWAPNANIELKEAENGYTKVTDLQTVTGGSSGGNLGDSIEFTTKGGKYYLWLPTDYSEDVNTQSSTLESHEMDFTPYDTVNNKGLYTFTYRITEPNRSTNPTIIYYINQSVSTWNSDDIGNIDINESFKNNSSDDSDPKVALSSSTFNLNNTDTQTDRRAPAFYVTGFKGQYIDITIGYNPDTKEVIIIGYSSEGADTKTYDRSGEGTYTFNYYEVENNSNAVLANPDSSLAISSLESYNKAISFKDSSDKINILVSSVTSKEKFTLEKTGDGYEATYKLKNNGNSQYLTVSGSTVSFSSTGTDFSLAYVEGFTGPALRSSDGMYVVFSDGSLTAVSESELKTSELVTVFTGSGYVLDENSNETEDFKFYDNVSKDKGLKTLSETSSPPLFTSKTTDTDSTIIGTRSADNKIAVAKLKKANTTDTYYTAHIVIRIWAEGTDREAKTPLADGIFNTSLHFVSE